MTLPGKAVPPAEDIIEEREVSEGKRRKEGVRGKEGGGYSVNKRGRCKTWTLDPGLDRWTDSRFRACIGRSFTWCSSSDGY